MRIDPPRVSVITLGCAKNVADTDLLAGQLLRQGITVTGELRDADAILVNTCAFLTSAQEESIETILEIAEEKKQRSDQLLVVVGCLAQRHGQSLIDQIPEIDILVGPGEVHTLAARLQELIENGCRNGDRLHLGGMESVEESWTERVVSDFKHSAYVKISEGCDRSCSFCIIPKLRGRHRSRTLDSITYEVQRLAAGGVREINLVAQELTAYGIDLNGRSTLAALITELDAVEGIDWIRLLYTYPSNWSEELFSAIRDLPSVLPYVDIPIQHVSDTILRRMNRVPWKKTAALLDRLRSEIPDLVVRTTLMTGFPGEREADFKEMLDFVKDYRFDSLGVFAFSPEEGTSAFGLADPVPEAIREERRQAIMAAQIDISHQKNSARIGQDVTLLLDSVDSSGVWTGRHYGQAPEVDGCTFLRDAGEHDLSAGSMIEAVIEVAGAYDLEARPAMGGETR